METSMEICIADAKKYKTRREWLKSKSTKKLPAQKPGRTATITEWFRMRGRDERPYQIDTIGSILDMLLIEKAYQVVVGACPAAGKTVMSMVVKQILFKLIPGARSITLTHGQDILRTQYAGSLAEFKPNFSWELIDAHHEINGSKDIVTLPHTIWKRDLSEFDNGKTILFIDEGHQMFEGKMVQTIINKIKPAHIVYLTGTPAPHVMRKTPMVVVPLTSLIEKKYTSNVSIELAFSMDYTYGIGDLVGDELKRNYDFKKDKTYKTLDKLLTRICGRMKMDGNWEDISHKMRKTMYVCRNIKQANYVKEYFSSKGVDVALSDCISDKSSMEIERFKNSKTCTTLVVVYKGILGFDYPELCNIVDLSGSSNINRLFQMLCRLVRKSKDNHPKIFYKVVPRELKGWYRPIMNAMVSLMGEDGIRKFNGRNFKDMQILVRNMVESDFKEGEIYEDVRIVKVHSKNPKKEGYTYDIEVLGMDGKPGKLERNVSFDRLLQVIGVRPVISKGRGGKPETTAEKWIEIRSAQIPLDITSLEFFIDAEKKHSKHGVFALTTVRAVHECLGLCRGETLTDEELRYRFKKVLEIISIG